MQVYSKFLFIALLKIKEPYNIDFPPSFTNVLGIRGYKSAEHGCSNDESVYVTSNWK